MCCAFASFCFDANQGRPDGTPKKSSSLLQLRNQKNEPSVYDKTMKSFIGANSMCDFAYINFLREKVRQLEAEEKRLRAFGPTPSARFVPWIMPAQPPSKPEALRPAEL